MPDHGPSALDHPFHNLSVRFIDTVDVDVEIVIDDLTSRSDQE